MLNFFIYRARPVVNLEAKVTFVSEAGKIDMGSRDCVISTGESVSCVPIKTCLRYSGVGVEKKLGDPLISDHKFIYTESFLQLSQ